MVSLTQIFGHLGIVKVKIYIFKLITFCKKALKMEKIGFLSEIFSEKIDIFVLFVRKMSIFVVFLVFRHAYKKNFFQGLNINSGSENLPLESDIDDILMLCVDSLRYL